MERSYLIRYGAGREVGRFSAGTATLGRGQAVVIRTRRGVELGEVLAESPNSPDPASAVVTASARVLRPATAEDRGRDRLARRDLDARFEACRRTFEDGLWPIEVVDVEPLLDDGLVVQYLGPHRLDVAGLRAVLRERCGFEVVFEPVGRDAPAEDGAPPGEFDHGCGVGGCGSGGCGSGADEHEGCSGCAVKSLLDARRRG